MVQFKMKKIGIFIVIILSLAMILPAISIAKEYKFACSLGWSENESGQRQIAGFKAAVKELGGTIKFVETQYNPKEQSEQIEALILTKPDALFITPSFPLAIKTSVQHAVDAGIPVFVSDAVIPGVNVTNTNTYDFFGAGFWTMSYLCDKLGGKGKIGMITLSAQVAWDLIGQGARYALRNYPDIEIVTEWDWDATGAVTPRMAADNMLTAFPKKGDLNAIWCAWDGGAFEVVKALKDADREKEIYTVGCNGGEHAFAVMKDSPAFIATATEHVFEMAYNCVYFAHKYLAGEKVPYIVITPGIGLTREMLLNTKPPKGINLWDYDLPGVMKTFGWKRSF